MHKHLIFATFGLTFFACNTAFKESFESGQRAKLRNDNISAAKYFQRACRFSPDEKVACQEAKEATQRVTQEMLAAGKEPCETGQTQACLAKIYPFRPYVEKSSLDPLLLAATKAHFEMCGTLPSVSLADTVRRYRCVKAYEKDMNFEPYLELRKKTQSEIQSKLANEIMVANSKNLHGVSWALASLSSCIAPSAVDDARITQARQLFESKAMIPVQFSTQAIGSSQPQLNLTCLAVNRGRVLSCNGGPGGVNIDVTAQFQPFQFSQSQEVKEVEYVASVEQVPNPNYGAVLHSMRWAERNMNQAEVDLRVERASCDTATSFWYRANSCYNCRARYAMDSACNRAEQFRRVYNDRVDGYNRANWNLRQTPQYLENQIRDRYRYTEKTSRWVRSIVTRVNFSGALRGEKTFSVEQVQTGVDRVAFAPAGISASVAQPPTAALDSSPRLIEQMQAGVSNAITATLREVPTPAVPSNFDQNSIFETIENVLVVSFRRQESPLALFMQSVDGALAKPSGLPAFAAAACSR